VTFNAKELGYVLNEKLSGGKDTEAKQHLLRCRYAFPPGSGTRIYARRPHRQISVHGKLMEKIGMETRGRIFRQECLVSYRERTASPVYWDTYVYAILDRRQWHAVFLLPANRPEIMVNFLFTLLLLKFGKRIGIGARSPIARASGSYLILNSPPHVAKLFLLHAFPVFQHMLFTKTESFTPSVRASRAAVDHPAGGDLCIDSFSLPEFCSFFTKRIVIVHCKQSAASHFFTVGVPQQAHQLLSWSFSCLPVSLPAPSSIYPRSPRGSS